MKKILFVNACVRPESRTMILARHLLSKLEGNVEELDLGAEDIKNLDLERLHERDRLAGAGDFSDDMFKYARQFCDGEDLYRGDIGERAHVPLYRRGDT